MGNSGTAARSGSGGALAAAAAIAVVAALASSHKAIHFGGTGSAGGGITASTPKDPCGSKPSRNQVPGSGWHTPEGYVNLRCGNDWHGLRHILQRHSGPGSISDLLDCIGLILSRGTVERQYTKAGITIVYRFRLAGGAVAKAYVSEEGQFAGELLSALPGGPANNWARCAKG